MEFSIVIAYRCVRVILNSVGLNVMRSMNGNGRMKRTRVKKGTAHAFKWYLNDHRHSSTSHWPYLFIYNFFSPFLISEWLLPACRPPLPFSIYCDSAFGMYTVSLPSDSVDRSHSSVPFASAASHSIIDINSLSRDLYGGFSSDFNYAKFYGARIPYKMLAFVRFVYARAARGPRQHFSIVSIASPLYYIFFLINSE